MSPTKAPAGATPPDSERGWASEDGRVRWADMNRHLRWLGEKAETAPTAVERGRRRGQIETLRGWCQLFDHDLEEAGPS